MACERSCICLLVESLWPVIGHVFVCFLNRCCLRYGHVFVCLLNRCGLLSVMYMSSNGIVVASDRSCISVLVGSLWPVNGHVFVC